MIVCLLNGSHAVRERTTEAVTVLPCGCGHTDVMWVQMCREHGAPCQELHELAQRDHATEAYVKELIS